MEQPVECSHKRGVFFCGVWLLKHFLLFPTVDVFAFESLFITDIRM